MKLRLISCALTALFISRSVLSLNAEDTNDLKSIADQILDSAKPGPDRDALLAAHSDKSAKLIFELVKQIEVGTDDEYRGIPAIWKLAIAAGKRNQAEELKQILAISLPQLNGPLRDWQAVVIGGGIINGLSLQGIWPRERIEKILKDDADLKQRWDRSIELASIMADDEKVRHGTRYDALRMLGVASWKTYGQRLTKYLGRDVNGELQQGAVSGLSDMDSNEVAGTLIDHFQNLTKGNQQFALDALFRNDFRINRLLDSIAAGKIKDSALTPTQLKKLEAARAKKERERIEQSDRKLLR